MVLGQRYLLHDPRPQPLTWKETAAQLAEFQPTAGWGPKRVEHLVTGVRTRLSRNGVPWLTREEIGEPVGSTLNDNLLRELLLSTTLVPPGPGAARLAVTRAVTGSVRTAAGPPVSAGTASRGR